MTRMVCGEGTVMAAVEVCADEESLLTAEDPEAPSSTEHKDSASRCWTYCYRGAQTVREAYSHSRDYFTISKAKVVSLVLVSVLLCHSASRYTDSDSCQRLLSTGHFLGNNKWQPDGCMMHTYSSTEAQACLTGKNIVFIGGSQVFLLFVSFVNIMRDSNFPPKAHVDFHVNISTTRVHFLWNPWTNKETKQRLTSLTKMPVKPDAVMIGDATWIIRQYKASEQALLQYKQNLTSMAEDLEKLAQYGEVYWYFQEPVRISALKPSQKMIKQQINLYNEAATEALNIGSSRVKAFKVTQQAALQNTNEIFDDLHQSPRLTDMGAMVFLNSLCNKQLRSTTGLCCQNTSPLTVLQKMALCLFLASAVLLAVLHFVIKIPSNDKESLEKSLTSATGLAGVKAVCNALCRMGLIMVYFYLCDRTNMFGKDQKQYSHSAFFIPLFIVFVLGLLCWENTKESRVLNREQTDEWKGWMQLVILIYHFSGASAVIPVYMHVRVLVAAYLFQTGYGHLSFFWLKADFGLSRVCQVLFRLNFLVLVLCVVMDRPYQFYYFVPLVTMWFVTIYCTLAMWPQIVQKLANNSIMWHLGLLLKLLGLLLLICLFASFQGLFESTFGAWPVSALFELNGSIHEWCFRWKLDRFAVLQGMVFAFLYLFLQKKQVLMEAKGAYLFSAKVSILLLLLSLLSFITYSVWASSCTSKAQCNEMHPYISVVPILAFIFIRNIPGSARSVYSSFFAWFGKISLELFICQYHIWLAADTKGILVLIPGSPSLNILVSSLIFVCVAHEVSLITNVLAQALIPKQTVALLKRLGALVLFSILLWCLSSGYSL